MGFRVSQLSIFEKRERREEMCISNYHIHYGGIILKKKEEIKADKVIQDIENAAENANLKIKRGKKSYSEDRESLFVEFKIADSIEHLTDIRKRIILYFFSKVEQEEEKYDWIARGEKLTFAIKVEGLYEHEKIALDFLYEYLKINREDIFWNYFEWFYDYEAMKEIKEKELIREIPKTEFEEEWCYKKPKIKKKYHMPIHKKKELHLTPSWKKTCNLCGKEVFGKVERLDGNTYYGFYCKSCNEWKIKTNKLLEDISTFEDSEIYQLKLAGGENRYQIEKIAEIAEISIEEARRYLPIGEEIVVAEDTAENIWDMAEYLLKNDLYFEIEPEFPFQLDGQQTKEEKEEIREEIKNQLENKERKPKKKQRKENPSDKIEKKEEEGKEIEREEKKKGFVENQKERTGCLYCGGELMGKVEQTEKEKIYGLYCNQCKKWTVKDRKELESQYMEMDNEYYRIYLTGQESEKQIEQIAEITKLSVYEAGMYVRIEGDIMLYEGEAEELFPYVVNMVKKGVLFRISPEFPYKIAEKMAEEEKERITKELKKTLIKETRKD